MSESKKRRLSGLARRNAIAEDKCPECGGELDTGWECNQCGFDAMPEALALPVLSRDPQDRAGSA